MELEYSPSHAGGTLHLLSPTHSHGLAIDGFKTIRDIRRTLSRSPSKPARHSIFTSPRSNPASTNPLFALTTNTPHRPSALSRTTSANGVQLDSRPHNASAARSGLARARSFRRTSPNSPLRRALSDNTNQINLASRCPPRRASAEFDQENMDCSDDFTKQAIPQTRFDDEAIKFDLGKPASDKFLQPVKREHASPMKSSPLKRSDGVMNLEAASASSPRSVKRRSVHGSSLVSDFNIFDQTSDAMNNDGSSDETEKTNAAVSLSWNLSTTSSPQRRSANLRKSTLQQRVGPGRRGNLFTDAARDSSPSTSLNRTRARISLDGALPVRSMNMDLNHRRLSANDPPVLFAHPAQRLYQSAPKPHPLSHALTPSSSSSSVMEDVQSSQPMQTGAEADHDDQTTPTLPVTFSKSLPIGAMRPSPYVNPEEDAFETPAGYKMAKPLPQAFMSTGLLSKRHRNVDMPSADLFASTHMPDTPSKKAHHVHIAPTPEGSALGKLSKPRHEFGSPSIPFDPRASHISSKSFGKNVSIFGSRANAPQLMRRASFLSSDGDDLTVSPTHKLKSQPSNDDLPPTPTKSASTTNRPQSKGKSNSLRSTLLGRRTSLGPDTFAVPADRQQTPNNEEELASSSPSKISGDVAKKSPHTPSESFTPPDPSNLSISQNLRASLPFSSSSFPPATPTGPRADSLAFSMGQSHNGSSGYFANDVDTSLTSRFSHVTSIGIGEFSQVYKVQSMQPPQNLAFSVKAGTSGNVWAVKKSRRPYGGSRDRERKMQEVRILQGLRGHEHVVEFADYWESKDYLYIQTEYCENGNLKDFLFQNGQKGRLDDFRIWKILLELAHGIKSIHDASIIHLDLKPANVFINWEGCLKIGDFGLASPWPAPPGLDAEGDREYIGPEVLVGRFDKPADIFSFGMIMLETAGNLVLPDNGSSWQRLRNGNWSDVPSLTSSSTDSSILRNDSGEIIESASAGQSADSLCLSHDGDVAVDDDDDLGFLRPSAAPRINRVQDLVRPPNFMVDSRDVEALDHVIMGMIHPDPDERPSVDDVLAAGGVRWVEARRRAGATVFEGNWGPADDVLGGGVLGDGLVGDIEMMDVMIG